MRILIFCPLFILLECTSFSQSVDKIANMTREEAIYAASNDPKLFRENVGPWSSILEDWTVGASDHRLERIMKLPNTHGYYISNRVDTTPPSNVWSEEYPSSPKITSRPPQYNYPKQKPTAPNYAQQGGPPRREVTETDLYLLGAIEKLVYRVDFMEKRLRKAEELIYFVMAGTKKNPDPCPDKFTRAGINCYQFITTNELNWKSASSTCKDMGATLAEMETIEENQDVVTFIQANSQLRGKDFWTGGLNPGLLWIWSNSARPVANGEKNEVQLLNNATNLQDNPMNIKGSGRCLKLAFNPMLRTYAYMGYDCSVKHYYICEKIDKSLSNEIQRISRELRV